MKKDVELYNLTSPQMSLWLTEQFYQNTSINNVGGIAYIHEKINFANLEKAMNLVVKNNDGMRIRLTNVNNEIHQKISSFSTFKVELLNTQKESPVEIGKELNKVPFSIFKSALYKLKMFKSPNGENGFFLVMHHLISDAWTINLVTNQILSTYTQLQNSEAVEIVSYSYKDFISSEQEYLNSDKFIRDKLYWEEYFSCLPDIVSLKEDNKFSIDSDRKEFIISGKNVEKINSFCSQNKISQYIFFLSIYSIYFRNILNAKNYIIGNPILNRSNYKEKQTVGTFINTMPFLVQVNDDDTFVNHCIKLATEQKKMYRHIKYPLMSIQQYMKKHHSVKTNLFDILFSYQNAKINISNDDIKHSTAWSPNGNQVQSIMIHIKDTDNTGDTFIDYDYLTSVFSEEQINLMHERILGIIEQVLQTSDIAIKDVDIVTTTEKNNLLYTLNNTKMKYNHNLTIIDMFEQQVKKTPENIALTAGAVSLTYDELNCRANLLANELKKFGVSTGDIVGILLNRNENIIISIFAILKLGAIYMPIDPDYPSDRVDVMLENSHAKIVISTSILSENFSSYSMLLIDNLDFNASDNIPNLDISIDAKSLAYIMYTSGSTGTPKAVGIQHYNVINFVKSMQKKLDYQSSSDNKVLSVTTMCFDIFVFEVFPTLLSGLQLVVANEFEAKNPELLNNIILETKICKIMTTPSRIQLLFLDSKYLNCLKSLKEILLGGEPFPVELLPKLQKLTTAKICNLYGPTETTVYSTYKDLTKENNITIGTPIENTQIYILNENHNLLPINTIGEICIGGDGVGAGYYKNTELTDSVFVKNRYKKNDIIYKTGDLGKWTENGELLCFGRKDFQIKIRGYRVELGDIASNILTFPNIDKAIVIDREDSKGKKYLCAYIVSKCKIDYNSLQKYLTEKLPNYMVPSHFMQIEEIPLTLNHKVNRKALPEPETLNDVLEYVAPINDTQKKLCDAVSSTIDTEKVGITNDIFDYQIDSLNIITVQTKLLQNNIKISTQDFYKYRTIEKIAHSIDNQGILTADTYEQELYNINNSFKKHSVFPVELSENKYQNVLLLGSTGYFGIHLLQELLTHTDSMIYCLVRSKKGENPQKRLFELYKYYFNKDLSKNKNLKIIEADILENNFGVDSYTYKFLQKNINLVINSAANVKYYGDSKASMSINVDLTQKLVDFCTKNSIKFLYVSTMGVSGNLLVSHKNVDNIFTEDDFFIEQNYKDNIYIQTKFEAEKIIYDNIKNGLNACIFRIGNLTGRYSDGVFQQNIEDNAFYNILKSIVSYGIVPKVFLDKTLEFTPVDLCASACRQLAFNIDTNYRVFHLFNNNYISVQSFIKILNNLNFDIKVLNNLDYKNEIDKLSEYNITNAVVNSNNQNIELLFTNSVIQENDYTNDVLSKVNFNWENIDNIYLEKIIKFIKKIKFI